MKKSQTSAGSISILIVLIALFMVLYLIFIPPQDRKELLGINETSENGETPGTGSGLSNVLLSQDVGLLKPSTSDESEHEIDSVQLYMKNEPFIDDLSSSITVSRSAFSKETRTLNFNIDDMDNLNKVTLYFFVSEAKGDLIISLNRVEIFNSKAKGIQNVVLPRDLLEESNVLTFDVSSGSFFAKNTYTLTQIKINEVFELTNTKEERDVVLSASETGKGELSFYLFCNKAPIGSRLRIFANSEEIFNNVISCASSVKTAEIDEDLLKEGRNSFLFEVDKGDFLLNDIKLKVELEEGGSRTYKLAVTEKQIDDILDSAKEVKLTMDFKDDKQKRAVISINGNEFSLDTEELEYERFITSYIKEGNNFIRINPENEFTIDLLEIKII